LDTDPTFGVFFMTYSEQFRQQLVEEFLAGGIGAKALATRHGIDHSLLRRWIASYREHGSAGRAHRPRGDERRPPGEKHGSISAASPPSQCSAAARGRKAERPAQEFIRAVASI
jgi:transposase-like protein